MQTTKAHYSKIFFALFLFFFVSSSELFACPCFNMGFLHVAFLDDKDTECRIYKEGSVVYKIEIFDKEKIASSTHTQCTLNTEHHDVFMNYDFHYLDDHGDCIREILDACNKLKINSLHMDDA
ncbi:TPA: hypothetical protein I8Z14_003105 [Legionella pneumophila]|nr:hypothetical protein [Legionella pneumophila]